MEGLGVSQISASPQTLQDLSVPLCRLSNEDPAAVRIFDVELGHAVVPVEQIADVMARSLRSQRVATKSANVGNARYISQCAHGRSA